MTGRRGRDEAPGGGYRGADPYTAEDYGSDDYGSGRYASGAHATAGYPRQDGYAHSDPYGAPDALAPADPFPPSGRYASRGYPAGDGYEADDGYERDSGYGADSGYEGHSDYGADSGYEGASGYGLDSGYAEPGGYGQPGGYEAGSGYAEDDYDAGGYGPDDGYRTAGGYPDSGYGAGSDDIDGIDDGGRDARSARDYRARDSYSDPDSFPPDRYPMSEFSSEQRSQRAGGAGRDGAGRERAGRGSGDTSGSLFIPGLDDDRDSRRGGRRKRRVGRVLAPLLAVVMLAVVGVAAYKIYPRFHTPDFPGPGTGQVTVHVPDGATATSLAPELVSLGVVASTKAFIDAANSSKNPDGLQPGYFSLRKHMKASLAYQLLLNPKSREQTVVTIPDGLRATQIIALLQQKAGKGLAADAYANAIKDTAALGLPSYANGNPEGYLFPATYDITPGESPLAVLQAMVARFNQEAQSVNLVADAQQGQVSPGEVITIASLLEAEVGPQYYTQVAEVIYNRLNQGMPLELDSTVNYALNKTGPTLTQSQLETNSPYNTFIHTGVPPTPIDSPSDAAIQAALHPAHGDLLYFVTVNLQTGLTEFTDNQAQFNQFVQECEQNNAGC